MNRYSIKGCDDWFMNLTEENVPNSTKIILGMGHKFSLPYNKKDLPIENIIAEVEDTLTSIADDLIEEKNQIRRHISRSIFSFIQIFS